MKKNILFSVIVLLSLSSFCQEHLNGNKKDDNYKLIHSFIIDISTPDKLFSIKMLGDYFQDYEELESDVLTHHLVSKFGIDSNTVTRVIKKVLNNGEDTIPSFTIIFLRNRNFGVFNLQSENDIQILKYRKESIIIDGMEYKELIYKVVNHNYKDLYLLFSMNPYIDEKCSIISIKDKFGISVFE